MSSNVEVVRRYLESWHSGDPEAVVACFTDDVVYRDIPLAEPTHGIEPIAKRVRKFQQFVTEAKFEIHNIAESESGAVLTERTDRFLINGRWFVIEVAGVGRVRDGKIYGWTDYWDRATYERQLSDILGVPVDLEDLSRDA